MDVVKIDIDPTAKSFQHATLGTSGLLSSPIEDAEAVARIIFYTLPCVNQVIYHGYPSWTEVNRQPDLFAVHGDCRITEANQNISFNPSLI